MSESQPKQFNRFQFGEGQRMIAERIRTARKLAGFTQARLGKMCKSNRYISERYIQRVECGSRTISADNLLIVAEVTGKPIEFFYGK